MNKSILRIGLFTILFVAMVCAAVGLPPGIVNAEGTQEPVLTEESVVQSDTQDEPAATEEQTQNQGNPGGPQGDPTEIGTTTGDDNGQPGDPGNNHASCKSQGEPDQPPCTATAAPQVTNTQPAVNTVTMTQPATNTQPASNTPHASKTPCVETGNSTGDQNGQGCPPCGVGSENGQGNGEPDPCTPTPVSTLTFTPGPIDTLTFTAVNTLTSTPVIPPTNTPTATPTGNPCDGLGFLLHLFDNKCGKEKAKTPAVCSDPDVHADIRKVGDNYHVFRYWLDANHVEIKSQDLTPNLVGEAKTPAAHNCTVAFTVDGDVWTVGSLGGNLFQVTHTSAIEANADWRFDKITFDRDNVVFAINPNGTGEEMLAAGTNAVVYPNGMLAVSYSGSIWLVFNGEARNTQLGGLPVATTFCGLVLNNNAKLTHFSFATQEATALRGTDYVNQPNSEAVVGVANENGSDNWLDPFSLIATGDQPDWFNQTTTLCSQAVPYFNSLPK